MAEKNDDFIHVNRAWIVVNGGYSIQQAVDMEKEQNSEGTDSNDIDDFCHVYRGYVYRGWTQRLDSEPIQRLDSDKQDQWKLFTTPDRLAPQIIFQEKTVTTENDVIHVQRLLDEKEVSIVL